MNTTASNARLHKMVGCALFAALTAVCSQLAIPMPWGVPINLALFAVYMAGTMLGPVWGAASQLVYLLLAAVGVPVMAGMQGGPAVLLGKTGGYAIGYLLAALPREKWSILCPSISVLLQSLLWQRETECWRDRRSRRAAASCRHPSMHLCRVL